MYTFFRVIERAGIEQRHLARLMGVHESQLSAVKTGRRRPDHAFMAAARSALREIGIRQDDGAPYTVDALFFAPLDNVVSSMDNALTPSQAAD
jgi:transcriptional regulator with XRE-family HTH domain